MFLGIGALVEAGGLAALGLLVSVAIEVAVLLVVVALSGVLQRNVHLALARGDDDGVHLHAVVLKKSIKMLKTDKSDRSNSVALSYHF